MSGYLQRIARPPGAASVAGKPAAAPLPAAAAAPPLDTLLHEVVRWVSAPATAPADATRAPSTAHAVPSSTDGPAASGAVPTAQGPQGKAAVPALLDGSRSERQALPSPGTQSPPTRSAAPPTTPAWRIEGEPDVVPSSRAAVGQAEPGPAAAAMRVDHGLPGLATVLPAQDASPPTSVAAPWPRPPTVADRSLEMPGDPAHLHVPQPTLAARQSTPDGTVEVHVGTITLTVSAPPTPPAIAAPPQPAPATPPARAPAPAALRFAASRHHLRWS